MTPQASIVPDQEVGDRAAPKLYLVSNRESAASSEMMTPLERRNRIRSVVVQPLSPNTPYQLAKRLIDFVGALTMLVAAAPLMAAVAGAIKLFSPGPIVYRQRRLTEGGKVFTIYKFRTMEVEAEKASGPVFAATNDPRITPLGKFLRKTRLDELPQLVNVLKGEMSLVGPRPERPELAEKLEVAIPHFARRLRAKAGLTGLAQVAQGYPDGVDGYRKKLAWDLVYIRKQSVLLDLWIALKTVGVVFTGSGAR